MSSGGNVAMFCRQCYLPCGITTQTVNIMDSPASVAVHMLNMEIIIVRLSSCYSNLKTFMC